MCGPPFSSVKPHSHTIFTCVSSVRAEPFRQRAWFCCRVLGGGSFLPHPRREYDGGGVNQDILQTLCGPSRDGPASSKKTSHLSLKWRVGAYVLPYRGTSPTRNIRLEGRLIDVVGPKDLARTSLGPD